MNTPGTVVDKKYTATKEPLGHIPDDTKIEGENTEEPLGHVPDDTKIEGENTEEPLGHIPDESFHPNQDGEIEPLGHIPADGNNNED